MGIAIYDKVIFPNNTEKAACAHGTFNFWLIWKDRDHVQYYAGTHISHKILYPSKLFNSSQKIKPF